MGAYERFDTIRGTVKAVTRKGVIVHSPELPENSVCFCPVGLTVGDTTLFTIAVLVLDLH